MEGKEGKGGKHRNILEVVFSYGKRFSVEYTLKKINRKLKAEKGLLYNLIK